MRAFIKKDGRSGFSLVELMVCIVISAILALTLGTMLYYIFVAWRNNSDQVEIQRDATFSMDMLSRKIRPASFSQISLPDSTTLNIASESFYLVAGTNANSLYYDPDTSVSSDEIELIRDRVTALEFINNSPLRSITINMGLTQGRESLALDETTIGYRN
ncbi:PilW family protein [Candidatus Omnitrophota bacterium]